MMKNINWKNWILRFVAAAGIYLLTRSFWMSLGIMILLVVLEGYIETFVEKRRNKRSR